MAKRPTTLRVHQLAKSLGVSSKDIVAKCQAEGIPGITNHMSAVSLGLEATVREWFSADAGGTTTAVETAAPVDLTKVRAKAKKKTKSAAAPAEAKAAQAKTPEPKIAESKTAEPKTAEPRKEAPPAVEKPVEKARPAVVEPAVAAPAEPAPAPVVEAPPAEKAKPQTPPARKQEPAIAASAPETKEAAPTAPEARPRPVMNVPTRPEVITPAGPRLEKPLKTQLAGPKIIRVESPDVLPPPRSRGPRSGGPTIVRGGPRGGRGAGMVPGEMLDAPTSGPVRGRGGAGTGSRRNKRRSASAGDSGRAGRIGVADDRPFNWREQDLLERERRLNRAGGFFQQARRDNLKRSTGTGQRASTAAESGGTVRIEEPIFIKDLSAATGIKAAEILRKLFLKGHRVTINSTIESELAMELMLDYDIELEVIEQKSAKEQIEEAFEQREVVDERPRPPVVTILGHVDHGKTSLLDRIRKSNVASGEAGGITQATSAFQVPVTLEDSSRVITFIDTPGHEAFTEMRSRGAKVTDIVVLVVAADDGVMPQTIESISHAKAAGVPIVVALNKIDRPEATDANIQRILGQLAEQDLNPAEWGGSIEIVRTSALMDEGIQDLLEVLDYQAQLLELKADFGGDAQGTVLEAHMAEGRGPVASIIVQQGNLKRGDFIVVGRAYGRVRDILNDRGKRVDEASPSMPVAISGINAVPDAGDNFYVVKSLKDAEAAASERINQERERELAAQRITLDNIFQHLADSERKELPLVLKTDVHGSLETIKSELSKITHDEISVAIKHAAVGGVNESDIMLAEASGAIILGFNVTASSAARKLAESKGVDIRFYDVIYDILDDVKKAAEGLLAPELKLEVLGHAEVREVFKVSKVGMIAGCYVTDGVVERDAQIRVTRDGVVIEKDRRLEQLKRFKDDVKEVRAGQECGMKIAGYDDIRVGDVLECYKTLEVRRTL